MEETKYIWMDGVMINWNDAKIHVLSHSLHYGLGVFEGIRFYDTAKGPAIFRLRDHVERLFNGSICSGIKIPFSIEDIEKAIIETVKINNIKSGYIRPIVFYGYGKMGLNPTGAKVNIAIACWPWEKYLSESPIKVKTSSFIRIHPKSTKSECKITGHYVNSIFASLEIHEKGYDEALLLDCQGNISEGPGENIFIIKDNILYTPKLGNILKGITRDSIIKIAKDNKFKVKEKKLKLKDIYSANEAFFTGTAAEITSIGSIDDKPLKSSPGKITQELKTIFMDIVKGKLDKYESWLTYVNFKQQ